MIEMPFKLAKKLDLFAEEYPDKVNRFYMNGIRHALDNGLTKAFFYRIPEFNIVAGVPRHEFEKALEEIMEKLIESEHYELASECQHLIDRVKIENIIKESQEQ